jgi:hypothetical protein
MAGTTSVENIEKKLKGDLDQRWLMNENSTMHRDQFGNEIHKTGKTYILYCKQVKVCEVHRLHTAKLISTILLNDIVHYKDLD